MRDPHLWLKRALLVFSALAIAVLLLRYSRAVLAIVTDQERLQDWLSSLGPLGPLGLIALNAAQVVVAPVPGYLVQLAGGYLFGWLPGAIYGSLGMSLGGAVAMTLARIYGRPLVRRLIGEQRLARWEQVSHINSLALWFIIMLGPFGDAPYFIAGLTRLQVWKIVVIALLVRGPSVTVAAAIGAGLVSWRSPWVIASAAALISLALLGMRHQDQVQRWLEEQLLNRLARWRDREQSQQPAQVGPLSEADQSSPSRE